LSRTKSNGLLFFKGTPNYIIKSKQLSVSFDGILKGLQNTRVAEVKKIQTEQCQEDGRNAVINFQCDQKSSGFFQSLLLRDDLAWCGSGYATTLDAAAFKN
jgi:hypothetical protein